MQVQQYRLKGPTLGAEEVAHPNRGTLVDFRLEKAISYRVFRPAAQDIARNAQVIAKLIELRRPGRRRPGDGVCKQPARQRRYSPLSHTPCGLAVPHAGNSSYRQW